jgi:hypothetical protein
MAKNTVKKVDVKKEAKKDLSARLAAFFEAEGFTVKANAADYGFSEGTLIVSEEATDIQIKLITPKAGLTRYEVVPEEAEVEA